MSVQVALKCVECEGSCVLASSERNALGEQLKGGPLFDEACEVVEGSVVSFGTCTEGATLTVLVYDCVEVCCIPSGVCESVEESCGCIGSVSFASLRGTSDDPETVAEEGLISARSGCTAPLVDHDSLQGCRDGCLCGVY